MTTTSTSEQTDRYASALAVPQADRVFGFSDHAALWFSLGVGLLVMQVGTYLVPALSLPHVLVVVVLGSLLGAGMLAWVASIGCREGLSSSALVGRALGRRFAMLPVTLNVVQLLGWAAFEIAVMRDGTGAIARELFGFDAAWLPVAATLAWGGLLVLLASGSMLTLVRQFVRPHRAAAGDFVAALADLAVWFTCLRARLRDAVAAARRRLDELAGRARSRDRDAGVVAAAGGRLCTLRPQHRQYLARYLARVMQWQTSGATAWACSWSSTAQPGIELVATLLLAQGGLIALGLILIDEVDNAYGDLHSGAVSINFLRGRLPVRSAAVVLGLLATAAALFLPMHSLEPFLLLLSSIFVPLFGVVISQLAPGLPPVQPMRWAPAVLWLLGIATFHAGAQWWPAWGSALPSLALTLLLGSLLRGVGNTRPVLA